MGDMDYQQVLKYEGWGGVCGSLGLQVNLATKAPLTDELKRVIDRHSDALLEAIRAEIIRTKPETIERVQTDRAELVGLFPQAVFVEEIPNGYGPNDPYFRNFPWYRVTTTIGPIVLGWRKRVISIDYSGTTVKAKADKLFKDDVTRFDQTIHAWSIEKAQEYINTLLNLCEKCGQKPKSQVTANVRWCSDCLSQAYDAGR